MTDFTKPPLFPNVDITLVGIDGNAFNIMGLANKTARQAGATTQQKMQLQADMISGDYDNLLATVMHHFPKAR